MTGRAKARLAVLGLCALIFGLGVPIATSGPARVRYWSWRMRSNDLETRRSARLSLLEIGRPAIDRVLPELVAGEARDRIPVEGSTDPMVHMAFVGKRVAARVFEVERAILATRPREYIQVSERFPEPNPVREGLEKVFGTGPRRLVVGNIVSWGGGGWTEIDATLDLPLAENDPLKPALAAALTAALGN